MRIFVYSDIGHAGVAKHIHHVGGRVYSADADPKGGVISCTPNGDLATYAYLTSTGVDVFPLNLDTEIPDPMIEKLAAHTGYGIKKGDTFRVALRKVRDYRGGDPVFDPDIQFF